MKLIKKLLIIILTILLTTACSNTNTTINIENNSKEVLTEGTDGSYYLKLLEDFEVNDKNINNTEDNKEFARFEDEIFKKTINLDFMTLNSLVYDYKSLGIEKPKVIIYEEEYGSFPKAQIYKDILDELITFDYNSLSYTQQYDYEYIKYDMLEYLASEYFSIYDQPFNISNDICGNVINNLMEYRFTDAESFNDFVTLLNSFDESFDSALKFTKAQFENGVGLTNEMIEYEVNSIDKFIAKKEDNQLIVNFNNNIDQINLSLDREKLKNEVKDAVINVVIPTYEKVKEELLTYKDLTTDEEAALINVNKDFARYLYIQTTSSNDDIDDIFEDLSDYYADMSAKLFVAIQADGAYDSYLDISENGLDSLNKSYEEIIDYLNTNMTSVYPSIGKIPYTISKLDPSVAQDTVVAYYLQMPVDNIDLNIIKINPNNFDDGTIGAYSTIAHEGIPGHLYQFYYYAKTNPTYYRLASGQLGYLEGQTVTGQTNAIDWLDIENDATAYIFKVDESRYFYAFSLMDIGINYYGWTLDEFIDFEKEISYYNDDDSAEYLYDYLVACPTMYTSYGVGALNYMLLRENAEKELGKKFDVIKYHEQLLKNGPLPFVMLEESIDEYIELNK